MYHASAKGCCGKARQMYVGDVGTRVRMEVVVESALACDLGGDGGGGGYGWADRYVASSGEWEGSRKTWCRCTSNDYSQGPRTGDAVLQACRRASMRSVSAHLLLLV